MSKHTVTLRPATPNDLPTLQYWDQQQHVKDAIGSDDDDWQWEKELPRSVPWRELLIAENKDSEHQVRRAIGFIQIIDPQLEETHYWGEVEANLRAIDIWIGEARDLGKGFGQEMMRLALARCFDSPNVEAVLIDPLSSNTRAHKFYRRLGFEFVETRVFDTEQCSVHRLSRSTWLKST